MEGLRNLLLAPLALLMVMAVLCAMQTMELVSIRQKLFATYPTYSDLSITAVALSIMLPLRYLLVRFVFSPLGNYMLPTLSRKKTWTPAGRQDRVERFATVCFKFLYFLIITTWGYILLKDQSWFPPILGGSGDVQHAWDDFPCPPVLHGLTAYYMIELAYHVQSLVYHLFMPHRNDFLEMTLHHSCAIFLVLFSHYHGYVRIGSLVLFIHDVADILSYAIKAVVDTEYTKVTLGIYAGLLVVWGVTRLYVFPFYILRTILYDGPHLIPAEHFNRSGYRYLEGMLYILQCLHIYWYFLFLIIGYQFTQTGKTVDLQQKAGVASEYEADKKLSQSVAATAEPKLVFLDNEKLLQQGAGATGLRKRA
jgi:hypothetical protein